MVKVKVAPDRKVILAQGNQRITLSVNQIPELVEGLDVALAVVDRVGELPETVLEIEEDGDES